MRGGLGSGIAAAARSYAGRLEVPAWIAHPVRPTAAMLLIGALIFTYAWRLHDFIPGLTFARPTVILALALLVAVVTVAPAQIAVRIRSTILALLVLFVAVAAAGAPFAIDSELSTRYLMTWLIPGALLALLIAVCARGVPDLEWIATATAFAAVTYVAVAYARGGMASGPEAEGLVFYDRNEVALMLVGLLPVVILLTRPGERPAWRVFGAACFALFVHTIVRGGSRGGLVGLLLVLAYVLATFAIVSRRARGWTIVATVVLLAAGGPAYWERVKAMLQPSTDYNWSGRSYGRGELWRRGIGYIRDHPVSGVGLSNFPTAERELSAEARRRAMTGRPIETLGAHNSFIQVAAELGLGGLAAFVALLTAMGVGLARARRRVADVRTRTVAHVLIASLIGYVVCGFFLSAAYFPFLFILVGLSAALVNIAGGSSERRPPTVARKPAERAAVPPALKQYELPAPARW